VKRIGDARKGKPAGVNPRVGQRPSQAEKAESKAPGTIGIHRFGLAFGLGAAALPKLFVFSRHGADHLGDNGIAEQGALNPVD
jgi:hypothetical protein